MRAYRDAQKREERPPFGERSVRQVRRATRNYGTTAGRPQATSFQLWPVLMSRIVEGDTENWRASAAEDCSDARITRAMSRFSLVFGDRRRFSALVTGSRWSGFTQRVTRQRW